MVAVLYSEYMYLPTAGIEGIQNVVCGWLSTSPYMQCTLEICWISYSDLFMRTQEGKTLQVEEVE